MGSSNAFFKVPQAVLDYKFDWSAWLAEGETISSRVVAADTGITVDSSSITDSNTSVTIWLSGGTENTDYHVTCRIATSANRTDERRIRIKVRLR